MEKEKEGKRRAERHNRDAFKELLKTHKEDGNIQPKMRWKVRAVSLIIEFHFLEEVGHLGLPAAALFGSIS